MNKNEQVFKLIWGAPFAVVSGTFPTTKDGWIELLRPKIDIEEWKFDDTLKEIVNTGIIQNKVDEMLDKINFSETKEVGYFFRLFLKDLGIEERNSMSPEDFAQFLLDFGFDYCHNDDVLKIAAVKGRELYSTKLGASFGFNYVLTQESFEMNNQICTLGIRPGDFHGPTLDWNSVKNSINISNYGCLVKLSAEKLKEIISENLFS